MLHCPTHDTNAKFLTAIPAIKKQSCGQGKMHHHNWGAQKWALFSKCSVIHAEQRVRNVPTVFWQCSVWEHSEENSSSSQTSSILSSPILLLENMAFPLWVRQRLDHNQNWKSCESQLGHKNCEYPRLHGQKSRQGKLCDLIPLNLFHISLLFPRKERYRPNTFISVRSKSSPH